MSEMGRSRSLREYRDQLRGCIGIAEAEIAALQAKLNHAIADRDRLYDTLDTIESELATRAAGSGHLPQ